MPSYFLSTPLLPALFHRLWPDYGFWDVPVPMQAMAIMESYSDDGSRHDDELASSEMAQTSRHASEMATGGSSTDEGEMARPGKTDEDEPFHEPR